jgi:hypothetical protein
MSHFAHRGRLAPLSAGLVLTIALAVLFVGVARAEEGVFGISSFSTTVSSPQAGAHADFTTSFAFDTDEAGGMIGQVKDVRVQLPVGVVGDPQATPMCSAAKFSAFDCPTSAQVGVLNTRFAIPGEAPFEEQTAVYNMVPSPGHAATLASTLAFTTVVIQTDVRRDGSYGLEANVRDVSSLLPLQSSSLTLWGVPADPSHNPQRIGPPPGYGTPTGAGVVGQAPFMINPSACEGPLEGSLSVDSWENPGVFVTQTASLAAFTGCDALHSSPTIGVTPETTQAASPSGYEVDLGIPQNLGAYELATPDLRSTVVTLPAGTVVSPAAANGLGVCSEAQIGLGTGSTVACPDASKIGTLEAVTPVLANPLVGSVYLAAQSANPFGSLLAIYLVAEAPGVQVKLPGEVHLDPVTGQITTTVQGLPQAPISQIKLHLFGGPGAALVTPALCGAYTTNAQLASYSSLTPAEPSSVFQITSGPGGAGCSGTQPFNPAFTAGTTNNQAGGFSPFTLTLARSDGDQELAGIVVHTPPGLLGLIKSVPLCGEPQASQGTCGAGSLIGHATVAAGAGPDPLYVSGQVFLTGPYKGAPYGLSVVVPAIAGPFDLGTVIVRSAVSVDPHTAQITVSSDALPSILQGVPLQLKTVNVTIDRQGFTFNPTSCEPLSVTGTLTSTQGATSQVSSPFHAANCAALGFHPAFSVSTGSKTSKQNGASLTVNIGYPSGAQANIHSVAVSLPRQLPSRLTTIQQACTEAAFAQNPASCPAGSNVGTAVATTPVLAGPLTGPVYLVSHGGAAFPDLVLILQGEGVTIELVGSIDIKHGVTSSTFATVPDAPVSSFTLKFPQGPHSALTTNLPAKAKGNLCGQNLVMPTTITGQNGAVVKQSTKIAVSGCPKAKPTRRAHSKKKTKKGKNKKGK